LDLWGEKLAKGEGVKEIDLWSGQQEETGCRSKNIFLPVGGKEDEIFRSRGGAVFRAPTSAVNKEANP
jgi:hypothetical protein